MYYSGLLKRPMEIQRRLQRQLITLPSVQPVQVTAVTASARNGTVNPISTPSASIAVEPASSSVTPHLRVPPVCAMKKRESYIDRPLSTHELFILKRTSVINGNRFVPWMDKDALDFDSQPFLDDFDYHMKPEFIKRGCCFVAPSKLSDDPTIIKYPLDPFVVQQHNVADCTIVSSIISCANYEVRFKKPLITGILYPQRSGRPVFNPMGKYIVKLVFNGVPRKVVSDHRILVTSSMKPLTTFSRNMGELWPILLEKAFLKVHGGYSYDGGNGGQDTYSLTGWIPESIRLSEEKNADAVWSKLYGAFKY